MRRLLLVLGGLVLALILAVAGFLGKAHWEIREVDPALPDAEALASSLSGSAGPVRIRYLNTASQRAPAGTVAYPAFLLEWRNGRELLIDAGMARAGAIEFGKLLERLLGADPIEPLGSVAAQLGGRVSKLRGIAFTHLHADHTEGLVSLCGALGRGLPVLQTPWQAERLNYSTTPGDAHIERAGCAERGRFRGGPVYSLPAFPGVVAIAAGGHTPGSTIFAAKVGGTTWILAGDVTNSRQALLDNEPKPLVYSLLIVPEATARLEKLRLWLAALDAQPQTVVVVSHDQGALEESGMAAYSSRRTSPE